MPQDLIFNRTLDASSLSTLAALATLPGPPQTVRYYCEETDAPYEFVPGDTTAVDGWTSIAPTGGTAGRWLLRSDRISIAPIGGAADDWVRLNAAMAACAYKCRVEMRSSSGWTCSTAGVVPEGTHLYIETGSTITSTMQSGAFTAFVFHRFLSFAGAGILAASVTVGSNQFSSSVSIPVGTEIFVRSATANTFLAQRYTVTAVTGVGPFTITVERSIQFPFLANDLIRTITVNPRNITLEGNNCIIKPGVGVNGGDRAIEFTGMLDGLVKGFQIQANAAGSSFVDAMSIDIASLRSRVEDVHVSASNASNGIMFESAEQCQSIRSGGNGVGYGTTFFDSVDCAANDCHGSVCGTACIRLDSNGVTNVGCKDIRINGGDYSKSPNDGLLINRAQRTTLTGVRWNDNGSIGCLLTNCVQTLFVNCSSKGNTTYDTQVASSNSGTRFVGYTNTGGAVALQIDGSDVGIDGMSCSGVVTGQCIRADGGNLVARNLNLTATTSANLIYLTGGTHKITDSTWVGTSSGLNCAGATVTIGTCSGTGTGIAVYNSAGTVIFSAGNDFTGFTTPIRNDNGSATISHDSDYRFAAEPVAPAAGTWFMATNGALSAAEGDVEIVVKKKTTFRDIDLIASIAPGGAVVCTFTFRKNNADTALVVALTGAQLRNTKDAAANATCINCVPGDKICVKIEVGGGSVMANPRATPVGVAA